MNSVRPYKILIYSHDTYGLGHIRRCLAIARSLRDCPANILILTGSIIAGRYKIPSRIDFVRIPGMIKVTNEEYLPLSMKLEATEVLDIRKEIILATAKAFIPDYFIVDKAPLGLKREVVDTLHWLKNELPSCKSILGLRDIMDSSASTIEDWTDKGIYEAMDRLYDEIWVYGCQDFYDPVAEYRIPLDVASKIQFTGYIPRQIPSRDKIQSTRQALGIRTGEKLVVVTTGGGGDGHPVVRTFLSAFDSSQGGVPRGIRVVIVTGPFISPGDYQDVVRKAEALGFITQKFYRSMERLIGAAQVVVSMGGYNTVCEIVSQKKPLLIVPRTVPREEQLIRAQVLCSMGFCDYLDPRDLTPTTLRRKVLHLLEHSPSSLQNMASFPFTALDVIKQRIMNGKTEMRG
ncbi:MAG: glycosyltransferase [Syntrophobacteraceae bacterium]|nr:glycosyltransferase [Syntrophobacteraceae bacterium]